MLKELLSWLVPAVAARLQAKLVTVSDEDIRAIARGVVGDGKGSLGAMVAEARRRVEDLGGRIDDAMTVRIGDAIEEQIALVRLPDGMGKLGEAAAAVEAEWEAAEERGRARGSAIFGEHEVTPALTRRRARSLIGVELEVNADNVECRVCGAPPAQPHETWCVREADSE